MNESTKNLIDLIDVNVARGDTLAPHPVMRHVNWTINETDFWVVGGVQGTGKGDLLATAAGLQKPLAGTHLLFGRDVQMMTEEELGRERLKIGMVFGNGRLFPKLTIAQNVALPLSYHKDCDPPETAREVENALEICGLSSFASKYPAEVTRNLHQRAGLARALILDPAILLIENPLFGIDQRQTRWWLDFLGRLSAEKNMLGRATTVVVATDDFRPWTEIGKQFGVIKNKEWLAVGSSSELRESPEPLVQEMLAGAFDPG